MNELYKLLQNIQQIAIANNKYLEAIEAHLQRIEKTVTIDIAPNADGAIEEVGDNAKTK